MTGAVTGGVRVLLRAEGLAALAAAVALYAATGRGWGCSALRFLAPDLSVAAYLAGPRVGATAYNLLHTYVGPLALALSGPSRPPGRRGGAARRVVRRGQSAHTAGPLTAAPPAIAGRPTPRCRPGPPEDPRRGWSCRARDRRP